MQGTLKTAGPGEDSFAYRGWLIAVGASLAILVSFGIRSSFSTIIEPLQGRFLEDRTAIASIGALNLLLYGLLQPLVGYTVDRYGGRIVLAASTLFLAAGVIGTGLATQIWHVYLSYGVFVAVGIALSTPVSVSATVSPWFEKRRGFALSVANAGSPLGQLLIVPLSMWLMLNFGLKNGYQWLGVGIALFVFPLVLWLLRTPARSAGSAGPSAGRSDGAEQAEAAARPLRTPTFWLLCFGMLVCGYSSAGVVITHLVPHATCLGLPPMVGATALALIGATNFTGMLVTGQVMDRIGRVLPLATLFLIRGVSHIMILTAGNDTMFLVASGIYGFTHSATMSATAALIGDHFGKRRVGLLYGYMMLGHQVAAAAGAYLGGVAFDLHGTYAFSLVSAASLSVLAAGTSCLLLRERKGAVLARA